MEVHDFKAIIRNRLGERNVIESFVNKSVIYDCISSLNNLVIYIWNLDEVIMNRFLSTQHQLDTFKYENERLKSAMPVTKLKLCCYVILLSNLYPPI